MRGVRAAATLGGLLLFAGPAFAAPPRVEPTEGDVTLEYLRDPAVGFCPDEAAFRERASDSFDFDDPFVAPGLTARSHLRVEIAAGGKGFHGTLATVDDEGLVLKSSSEEHVDCDALVWVLAHRVALAVLPRPNKQSPQSPKSPPRAEKPNRTPIHMGPAPLAKSPVCDERCAREIRLWLSKKDPPPAKIGVTLLMGGLMTMGWSAEVGPGAFLGAEIRSDWFSLGLEARGIFPARTLTYAPKLTSDVITFSALLAPCAHWRAFYGCAFVEVGPYIFTIPGNAPAIVETLVSLGPRVGFEVPLAGGFSARVFGDVAFHPNAPIFGARLSNAPDSTVLRWPTPVASGLLGVGIAWSR